MLRFGKTAGTTLDGWSQAFRKFETKKAVKLFIAQFFFQIMVATALTTSVALANLSGSQEILIPTLVFAGITATMDLISKSVNLPYSGHSGSIVAHVFWGLKWNWIYALIVLIAYATAQILGAGLAHIMVGGTYYVNATVQASTPGIHWYGAFIAEIIAGFIMVVTSYLSPMMGANPSRSLMVGAINGFVFVFAFPISGAGLCIFRWLGTNIWKISVFTDAPFQWIYPVAAAAAVVGLVVFAWLTSWIAKRKSSKSGSGALLASRVDDE